MPLVKKWFFKIIVLLLIIISVSLNFRQCSEKKIANQNFTSLTNTLKVTKNKLDETVKSKALLILDLKDLQKTNGVLSEEVNKLSKKDKKNLIEIDKLSIYMDMLLDSINVLQPDGTVVVNDTTTNYTFSKNNKWRELEWDVTVVNSKKNIVTSSITKDKLFADITIGKKEESGKIIFFASSSNPYVNITEMTGAIVDIRAYNKFQKKKPFGLGISIGSGLSTNNSLVYLSPYVGLSLNYNFINF